MDYYKLQNNEDSIKLVTKLDKIKVQSTVHKTKLNILSRLVKEKQSYVTNSNKQRHEREDDERLENVEKEGDLQSCEANIKSKLGDHFSHRIMEEATNSYNKFHSLRQSDNINDS